MKALIPGSFISRNVLATARSMGRAGYDITLALPTNKQDLAADLISHSRYVSKRIFITPPEVSSKQFVQDILAFLAENPQDVILPITHKSILACSYHKDDFKGLAGIPVADYEILEQVYDKYLTFKLASELNVPIPQTIFPKSVEDIQRFRENISFPCVIKARKNSGIGKGVRFAKNFTELIEGYKEISNQESSLPINDFSMPIIQEYIPGQIYNCQFLYKHGQCVASVTDVREITYPFSGGTGAVNQTVEEPTLMEFSQRMLNHVKYHGPCQVEYRKDPRDGVFKLLEINPKFWGTLDLSIKSGVNFPLLAAKLASGKLDKPKVEEYTKGLTYRWLFPDEIYSLVGSFSKERLKDFLHFKRENTLYDWDWSDIYPDIIRAIYTFASMIFKPKIILKSNDLYNNLSMANEPSKPGLILD